MWVLGDTLPPHVLPLSRREVTSARGELTIGDASPRALMDRESTNGTVQRRIRLSRVPVLPGHLGLPRTSRKSWGRAESPRPFISAAHRELCALYLPSQSALHLLAGEVQALESVQLDLLLPLLFEDHEKIGLWLVGHDPDL